MSVNVVCKYCAGCAKIHKYGVCTWNSYLHESWMCMKEIMSQKKNLSLSLSSSVLEAPTSGHRERGWRRSTDRLKAWWSWAPESEPHSCRDTDRLQCSKVAFIPSNPSSFQTFFSDQRGAARPHWARLFLLVLLVVVVVVVGNQGAHLCGFFFLLY